MTLTIISNKIYQYKIDARRSCQRRAGFFLKWGGNMNFLLFSDRGKYAFIALSYLYLYFYHILLYILYDENKPKGEGVI